MHQTYSTHLLRHLRFTIGRNIRARRTAQKLTLRKLARLTSIDEHRIDQFELGKNEIRLDELLKLACVLEVEVGEMMLNSTGRCHDHPNCQQLSFACEKHRLASKARSPLRCWR